MCLVFLSEFLSDCVPTSGRYGGVTKSTRTRAHTPASRDEVVSGLLDHIRQLSSELGYLAIGRSIVLPSYIRAMIHMEAEFRDHHKWRFIRKPLVYSRLDTTGAHRDTLLRQLPDVCR